MNDDCNHKWKTLEWFPDGCGCCGELKAVCIICEETIDEYLNFGEIEELNLDDEEE